MLNWIFDMFVGVSQLLLIILISGLLTYKIENILKAWSVR